MLREHPTARDHDTYLYHFLLMRLGRDPKVLTVFQLLSEIKGGSLPSMDTVSRVRRLLQYEKPELRGPKWKERHARADDTRAARPDHKEFTDALLLP